ncbi:MAG: rhodanese-like domain-containing protein [Elusimicrobia bacterium]|nr:rhodanese-like domain-containing protein [Elusimicrobiota bacterium]
MAISWVDGAALAAAAVILGALACSRLGGVKPAQAAEIAKQPGTFVLDVRTQAEYEQGHLERAVLIPVQLLAGRLSQLPADKKSPILVYCAVGGRSAVAATLLRAKGYGQVHDLAGGISAWQGAGFPVVK